MPVTIQLTGLKYKNSQGQFQSADCLKGEDADISIIAPDYSELTFPVNAGKLCTHDLKLYRAKHGIPTSENWTESHWDERTIEEELAAKYTKPAGGIPASDLADGVIPDIIDDEAGAGDTDVTFSADKLTTDLFSLSSAITSKQENTSSAISPHETGDVFWFDGKLCAATDDIEIGDTIALTGNNANAIEIHIGDELKSISDSIPVSVITPASGSSFTLLPCPVTYAFGEKSVLTVTVSATSQYHFSFESPSGGATVLTINGITGTTGDTVEANAYYEVDVWAGVALIKKVEVTAVT